MDRYGRPNQPLTLSWRRKVDDRRAELPLRVRARLTSFVGLGEDAGQVSTSVRVEVLQGLARDVTLALPPGLVVNYVNGADGRRLGDRRRAAARSAARAGR